MRNSAYSLGLALLVGSPLTAATFTVNTTADSAPAMPLIPGSLRWAIDQANNTAGPDIIRFSIPGPGVQTIVPLHPLPPLTGMGGVWIDGFSQPGAGPGAAPPATATLLIEIQGTMAGPSDGIRIESDNNRVEGLVINQFQHDGIHIHGAFNGTADFNLVFANFVGTDPSGTVDLGNGTSTAVLRAGIHVSNVAFGNATHNTIDGNLVSGNWSEGVWIAGPVQPGAVNTNYVTDNRVGTDKSGSFDLGNDHQGVDLTEGTTDNEVLRNLVSGNDYDGIGLQGFPQQSPIQTANNLIAENVVGLDASATIPLPNSMHGITLGTYGPTAWGCTDSNTVRGNVIAYNGGDGIAVVEDGVNTFNADGNLITRNSIWSNLGLGIDLDDHGLGLGVTSNDPGDLDTGANQYLNFPVLTSARHTPVKTTITGSLQIDVSPNLALVEVFKARVDPSGHGEGEVFLGAVVPAPDGSWSLTTTLLRPGDRVTATATDPGNNTSEFSQALAVVRGKVLPKNGTD